MNTQQGVTQRINSFQQISVSWDLQAENRRTVDPTVPVRGGYIDLLILSLDEKCEVEESLNGSAGVS